MRISNCCSASVDYEDDDNNGVCRDCKEWCEVIDGEECTMGPDCYCDDCKKENVKMD